MELYSLNGAFYTQQMMNPMSTGQIALWHALVYIANKSRWPDWFTVAGITLVQLSGLSIAGVKKARNELKQRGIIDFRPNGTKATAYHLHDMQESSQDGSRNSSALIKQNNTVSTTPTVPTGDTPSGGGGAAYVTSNLRSMTAGNWDELRTYLEDGLSWELICHAVDEAAAQGKRSWAYVRQILNRYLTEGVESVEQARKTDGRTAARIEPPSGLNRWISKGAGDE